jgi:hypothetical protein
MLLNLEKDINNHSWNSLKFAELWNAIVVKEQDHIMGSDIWIRRVDHD